MANHKITPRTQKICPKCNVIKDLVEFPLNKNCADGHFGYCKTCKSAYDSEYTKTRNRTYTARDAKLAAERYQKNKSARNETGRVYYQKNHDYRLAKLKQYKKDHPEQTKELNRHHCRNRRAVVRSIPGNGWSLEEERRLISYYGGRCAYCGKKFDVLDMDHVVPVTRGGLHSIENIVPACDHCNGSKHNKPLLIWMYEQNIKNPRLSEASNGK